MSTSPQHLLAEQAQNQGPNCWQCRHFTISHIPSAPYACRLMGFQSRLLPSLEVLRTDGQFCRGFSPKATLQRPA